MRIDAQPLHVFPSHAAVSHLHPVPPQGDAAERALEILDGLHRHCIDHLLVKLRQRLRRREARLGQDVRVIEVDRRIKAIARRIVVDHFDIFADRAGLDFLPGDQKCRLVDVDGVHAHGEGRVVGEDAQRATPRRRNIHVDVELQRLGRFLFQIGVGCAKAVNVRSRLRCLRTKTGNARSVLRLFARQDHLVGTVDAIPQPSIIRSKNSGVCVRRLRNARHSDALAPAGGLSCRSQSVCNTRPPAFSSKASLIAGKG